jgi:hypothetical protein
MNDSRRNPDQDPPHPSREQLQEIEGFRRQLEAQNAILATEAAELNELQSQAQLIVRRMEIRQRHRDGILEVLRMTQDIAGISSFSEQMGEPISDEKADGVEFGAPGEERKRAIERPPVEGAGSRASLIRLILSEGGAPLTPGQIQQALRERGDLSKVARPGHAVSKILGDMVRSGSLTRVQKGLYALSDSVEKVVVAEEVPRTSEPVRASSDAMGGGDPGGHFLSSPEAVRKVLMRVRRLYGLSSRWGCSIQGSGMPRVRSASA